jgi:hypothetical protein
MPINTTNMRTITPAAAQVPLKKKLKGRYKAEGQEDASENISK